MSRTARQLWPENYYHIMTRGNNRQAIFQHREDYEAYLRLVKKYKEELPFELYHYCLMPNHIHLLVQLHQTNFSLYMKKLNASYAHYYRKRYGGVGHFWQDRFKSKLLDNDNYLLACGMYIEFNPVRAGLTAKPTDYEYSSCRYYCRLEESLIITINPYYRTLNEDRFIAAAKYYEESINFGTRPLIN